MLYIGLHHEPLLEHNLPIARGFDLCFDSLLASHPYDTKFDSILDFRQKQSTNRQLKRDLLNFDIWVEFLGSAVRLSVGHPL